MRPCFLPADTHQIKIVLVMGDDVVHGINITLTAYRIAVKNVHCGAEAGNPLGQSVVLGGLPCSDEDFVGGGLLLRDGSHPPPDCGLEGESGVLFYVFWVVQEVHLQGVTCFSVVVVPFNRNTT